MSFSSNIKDELYQIIGNSRHCQMAELVAVLHYLCREDEQGNFYIYTDHEELLQKCYKLLLRIFAPRKEGEEKPSFEQLCSADVLRTLKLVDDHDRLAADFVQLLPDVLDAQPAVVNGGCVRDSG